MMFANPQLDQEAALIIEVIVLYLAGAGQDVKLQFYHLGNFNRRYLQYWTWSQGRSAAGDMKVKDGYSYVRHYAQYD